MDFVRHATLLFCAKSANVQGNGAGRKKREVLMLIVQFIHPGREFPVSDTNSEIRDDERYEVRWSTEPSHYRRLVKHQGSYVGGIDGTAQEGELAFWTEWEGPTVAERMDRMRERVPARYSHMVQYPNVPQGIQDACACGGQIIGGCIECGDGLLNTDPCVFGNTFKYALCQQCENGVLRHLNEGDLIAFMSRIDGAYYLDTVFVVDSTRVNYTTGNVGVVDCSDEYRALTLNRVSAGFNFTFYRGKRFTNTQNVPFSFTPARICNSDSDIRDRCRLDIDAINACANTDLFGSELKQKFKARNICQDSGLNVWNEIVRQVVAQGFVLGVHFDWPTR